MKRIVFALLCLFAAGSAVAQTYACQFIQSAGMDKDPKIGWKVTDFKVDEPFFLTMSEGLIDAKSVTEKPIDMLPNATCSKLGFEQEFIGNSHSCADATKHLTFSEKTLNGGFAETRGAMSSSEAVRADSVVVSRFKCQKVR